MNNEITIRQAKPEDANELASLALRGMPGYPFESIYDSRAIKEEITAGSNRIIATNQDDDLLGTAVLGDDYMAEIKRVLVDPNLRKHGLGAKLTSALKALARERGVVPWADVRADQIGMQRAAHHYYPALKPVSIEMGKHIVYSHGDLGPARESMVHMSGLPLSQDSKTLVDNLNSWPIALRQRLADNMRDSLGSHHKNRKLVDDIIPSAKLVKRRIEHDIKVGNLDHERLSPDIIKLEGSHSNCLVISPDASGFVEGDDAESIAEMSRIALDIGLQIVTCYLAITDLSKITYLTSHGGMDPAMIRPWQKSRATEPEWQVGLRTTDDTYHSSLHEINLDPSIRDSILSYINLIRG